MVEMTLAQLAETIQGTLEGDGSRVVRGLASVQAAGAEDVTFLANQRYERHMESTAAAAVIVPMDYKGPRPDGTALIRCKDPYFAFREAMVKFHGFRPAPFSGVSARAEVDPSAELAESVCVAPLAVISAGCRVGEGTVIYPGAFVGPNCRIGRNCIVYPNVTLYDGTILHDRVTIHAGTSVGQDGFGYATHGGRHEKIPQAGWVEIEDDVELGACCAIDRATMGATIVGAGTKMSNLVAIGHGTQMGKHCLVVAQVGIAGSVMVGDYCVLAGQCGVVGHIRLGNQVRVAAQSGVTNDVPDGQEVLGSPAIPLAQARRAVMAQARLPQLRTALQKLTKEVQELRDSRVPKDRPGQGG